MLAVSGVSVRGICAAVPRKVVRAEDMGNISDHDLKRMIRSTGFEQFRVAEDGKTTADYCAVAASALMRRLSVSVDSIDAIVFVSQTPDYIVPSTSVVLQSRLGLRDDVLVFDINHGCPGFVYGLFQSALLIGAGLNRILLCTGDTATRYADPNDRSTRYVFGDGAAVSLIENGADKWAFSFYADGSRYQTLWIPAAIGIGLKAEDFVPSKKDATCNSKLHMDGAEIMTFSLEVVPPMLENILQELGLTKEEIDIFALHQANKLIIETIAQRMGLSSSKMPFGAALFGNTSVASIPLLLSALYGDHQRTKRNNVILCGFGVGLTAATAYVSLRDTEIMRYVET